jgi:hypothetical protein
MPMRALLGFLLISFLYIHGYSQLCINEFLSSNTNGILDEDKEFNDWIELYNNGASALNITGYTITDDLNDPNKWAFPQISLIPSNFILVYASGKNRNAYPNSLQTIIDKGDEWRYILPVSDVDTSWTNLIYDDSEWNTGISGFGYGDEDDATIIDDSIISVFIRKEFILSEVSAISRLILSIDFDDGFVAYINGHEIARVNLGVTGQITPYNQPATSAREAYLWQGGSASNFEYNTGILREGTNVLAIQCHNNNITSSDLTLIPFLTIGLNTSGLQDISPFLNIPGGVALHTNFKIDQDGESLYLLNPSGTIIDSVGAVSLLNDVSYGRKPDGSSAWRFFREPTPDNTNYTNGVLEYQANPVVFSPIGGKHLGGVIVNITTANPNDSIYFTTDGSDPETSDMRYIGPLSVNTTQVIRARVIKHNVFPGLIGSSTYIVDLDHDIPIICLSTEPENLWNDTTGIYAYGLNPGDYPYFSANFWQDWERPVHFEFYDVSGNKKIDQLAGTSIFGGWSRTNDQKSMALFARKEYGKGSFNYQFFEDKPIDKFESIVLRNSGNDNLGLQFHDCFLTGLTRKMNVDRQAFQPAAVYLNGTYWGLLNIREKVNENFIAENHYVDADSVNLLDGENKVLHGTNEEYNALIDFLNLHTSLQDNSIYNHVLDQIDIDNFIQYQLTQIYINNRDWPGNNIKFWNTTTPGSKWRWVIFDTDFGYGIWNTTDYTLNTLEFALEPYNTEWPNPAWSTLMLRRMVTNDNFRNNFTIQFCDRLNLDFKPSRIMADLDSLQAIYDHEMVYTFARWWGSIDEWEQRIYNRKIFGLYRPDYCRSFLQEGFSLGSELEISVNVSDELAGLVKLNSIYPKIYPFNGIYFKDIPIKLTAIPRVGYKFVRWEGSINSTNPVIEYDMSSAGIFKAVFAEASAADISIIINEINYNSAPTRDTKDWVELYNNGLATVDLNGWLLSDTGPDSGYFFTEGMTMAPGDYLVICRDLEKFREYNTGVNNSVGDMPFGLSSDGDMLRLYDNESHLMDAVDYYIYSPWPENANGTGASIELINPSLDNTRGENWQAIGIGGTPGKLNFGMVSIPSPESPHSLTSAFDCFPNPFTDYTTIRFAVINAGHYRLEVVDINGRIVDVLADDYLAEGSYWIDWQGTSENNNDRKAGVYTLRLTNEQIIETIKIIMLK